MLINTLEDSRILTTAYVNAFNYINEVHMTHRRKNPKIGLLTGVSGVGKSTATRAYRAKYPDIEHSTYTEKRIIYIELTASCSLGGLYRKLFQAIMGQRMPKMSNDEAFAEIVLLCEKTKVQLIIVDEAQQILPENQTAIASVINLADALKNLVDKANCGILLTGLPNLRDLVTLKGKAEQLARQLSRRSKAIHNFAILTPDETKKVLVGIENQFKKHKNDSEITSDVMFQRFYVASSGSIDVIFDTIIYTLDRSATVDDYNLGITYDSLYTNDKYNPFKMTKEQVEKLFNKAVKNACKGTEKTDYDNA